jgi:hypothetical protein
MRILETPGGACFSVQPLTEYRILAERRLQQLQRH